MREEYLFITIEVIMIIVAFFIVNMFLDFYKLWFLDIRLIIGV